MKTDIIDTHIFKAALLVSCSLHLLCAGGFFISPKPAGVSVDLKKEAPAVLGVFITGGEEQHDVVQKDGVRKAAYISPQKKKAPKKAGSDRQVSALIYSQADALSRNRPPEYPYNARKFKQEGRVVLSIEVLPDGRAGRITVKESSGYPLLDRSAVTAVQKWDFLENSTITLSSALTIDQAFVFRLSE